MKLNLKVGDKIRLLKDNPKSWHVQNNKEILDLCSYAIVIKLKDNQVHAKFYDINNNQLNNRNSSNTEWGVTITDDYGELECELYSSIEDIEKDLDKLMSKL